MTINKKYIDSDIQSRYEFFDYGHALEILHESFPEEWKEIQVALRQLRLTLDDISKAGGNESPIPKKRLARNPHFRGFGCKKISPTDGPT